MTVQKGRAMPAARLREHREGAKYLGNAEFPWYVIRLRSNLKEEPHLHPSETRGTIFSLPTALAGSGPTESRRSKSLSSLVTRL